LENILKITTSKKLSKKN